MPHYTLSSIHFVSTLDTTILGVYCPYTALQHPTKHLPHLHTMNTHTYCHQGERKDCLSTSTHATKNKKEERRIRSIPSYYFPYPPNTTNNNPLSKKRRQMHTLTACFKSLQPFLTEKNIRQTSQGLRGRADRMLVVCFCC